MRDSLLQAICTITSGVPSVYQIPAAAGAHRHMHGCPCMHSGRHRSACFSNCPRQLVCKVLSHAGTAAACCTIDGTSITSMTLLPDSEAFGHKGRVFDLDFHPHDPSCLASASEDGSVRVWRADAHSSTWRQVGTDTSSCNVLSRQSACLVVVG